MNKKHVSKVGKYIGMACLLLVCAMVQSCRDEYFYDDREPDFIGSSIYDYLDGKGNFTYFLRVINDLGYKDVLQRTGSKTLFVADDDAFKKGIKEEWGFDEYSQLTAAHKRMILYGAMLDNAYLLEMLSKMQSTGVNAEPIPGQCLRQVTSAAVTDTIGLFSYREFPKNNRHWDDFKDRQMRLALDATQPMMLHFIQDQLYQKGILESDLRMLVASKTAQLSDVFVYDKKVLKKDGNGNPLSDIACKNGYVHQLEGLLIPPFNMAEEIRLNGNEAVRANGTIDFAKLDTATSTQLFSRLLDRFAVPVPIDAKSEIAQNFNRLYNQNRPEEKLYEKRYFTKGSVRGASGNFMSYEDENRVPHNTSVALPFDPGWNAYKSGTTDGVKKEHDMAAILAPSDGAMIKFFTEGSGKTLIEQYASDVLDNLNPEGGLLEAIDSIPDKIIEPLLRIHMQMSFNSSVPSKFGGIMDDARDLMGVQAGHVAKTNGDPKVILANNGVVYVMNTAYSPARYRSVIAPVMLADSLSIFMNYINLPAWMYDKYLLSMQNKFSLIVAANDEIVYYDPKYERIRNNGEPALPVGDKPRAYKFVGTTNAEGQLIIEPRIFTYNKESYDVATNTYLDNTYDPAKETFEKGNDEQLFKEILEYNIVLGDMNSSEDRKGRKKYYMSKGYGTVKVERDSKDYVSHIAGGRELENGAMVRVEKCDSMANGSTFQLAGAMIQPATKSVYNVLRETEEFGEFFALCTPNDDVLELCYDVVKNEVDDKGQKKYPTLADWTKKNEVFDDILVRMFDTYHYTIYVPTDSALQVAYEQGLPTWAELDELRLDESVADSIKLPLITSGVKLISKFVRYHFQDNSVFVDNVPHMLEIDGQAPQSRANYETSTLNESTNVFCKLLVQTDMEKNTIAVRGDFGESEIKPLSECKNVAYVIKKSENKLFNVMTRDIIFNNTAIGSNINDSQIKTSSYGVIHLIDNFLVYGGKGGIYDAEKKEFIR